MKLVNPNANEAEYKKLKTIKGFLTALPFIVALIGSILFGVLIMRNIEATLISAVLFFIVAAVVAVILHVYVYSDRLKNANKSVEIDLAHNIAVCDKCGRYFAYSELKWNLNKNVQQSRKSSEDRTITTYMGTISVNSTCPKCKTHSGCAIQVELGEEVERYKSNIFKDYIESSTSSTAKTPEQLQQTVKRVYDNNLRDAKHKIEEFTRNGYVIDDGAVKTESKPKEKDKAFYSVFLHSAANGETASVTMGSDKEAILKAVCEQTHRDEKWALEKIENGGIIYEFLDSDKADKMISALEEAGATVDKIKMFD